MCYKFQNLAYADAAPLVLDCPRWRTTIWVAALKDNLKSKTLQKLDFLPASVCNEILNTATPQYCCCVHSDIVRLSLFDCFIMNSYEDALEMLGSMVAAAHVLDDDDTFMLDRRTLYDELGYEMEIVLSTAMARIFVCQGI